MLEAGYAVASLNSEWADKDLSDVSIWPGPLGFNRTLQPAVTVNQVGLAIRLCRHAEGHVALGVPASCPGAHVRV